MKNSLAHAAVMVLIFGTLSCGQDAQSPTELGDMISLALRGDGIPEKTTGDIWVDTGGDLSHLVFTAHAATPIQDARGWATWDATATIDGQAVEMSAAGHVNAVFDKLNFPSVMQDSNELCFCGVMETATGPPPPPDLPPWLPTPPDIDGDGVDNEFCMYVVDNGEPAGEDGDDAAVLLHEGMPWSMWFPSPYPSEAVCGALKSVVPFMTWAGGNIQVHDHQ